LVDEWKAVLAEVAQEPVCHHPLPLRLVEVYAAALKEHEASLEGALQEDEERESQSV